MASASTKALALCVVLAVAAPSAAIAAAESPTDAEALADSTVRGSSDEPVASSHATLSTLAALGIGVLGLLRVRRRITEL